MSQELKDVLISAAQSTPAVAATAFTLNDAVAIATVIFIILQAAYLARKWAREEREWTKKFKPADSPSTKPGEL